MIKLRSNKKAVDPTRGLLRQLQNPQAALDAIGEHLVKSTKARIKTTKQSPNGVPWAPWTLGTLLGRIRDGSASRGLLYNSGRLLNSITYQATPPRGSNGRFQKSQVVVGSQGVPYAQFLQQGTPNMAARPFIGISKTDQEVITSILRDHISRQR